LQRCLRNQPCEEDGGVKMIDKCSINEKALEIRSKAHCIRAMEENGEMFFVASDIAEACGIKAGSKWVQRAMVNRRDLFTVSLDYPLMTTRGRQKRKLVFVNAQSGQNIVDSLPCKDETKAWLEKEVFSIRPEPLKEKHEEDRGDKPAKTNLSDVDDMKRTTQESGTPSDELNQRIDRILLELLEIKRCVALGTSRQ